MTDINILIDRYFAQDTDITKDGEQVPDTSQGNRITYLIDGNFYFGALRQEITALLAGGSNRFFYFTDWWLGLVQGPSTVTTGPGSITSAWAGNVDLSTLPPFEMDDGSGGPFLPLIDQLEQMAQNGVDVRALPWVAPFLVNNQEVATKPGLEGYWHVNVHTLLSTYQLRQRHGMADNVVLNTLAHSLGAMHLKMVICGDDNGMRAYVAGLDFVANRIAGWQHPAAKKWHDVGVKIEGPAARAIYNYYRLLWNEQVQNQKVKTFKISGHDIVSQTANTTPIPDRASPPLSNQGTQWVQVLRTAPQMNFATVYNDQVPLPCAQQVFARLLLGFKEDKLNFADHGIFEFRLALHKAISHAQQYIYIEDQSFSGIEIMDWINTRLKDPNQPPLKVILLYGADPTDPPNEFLAEAINHLIKDIPNVNDQVAFYERGDGVIVHSKVTIIDDEWAAVGSANCMRRSLYTDGECSIGVLDDSTPSFANLLRKDLWGEHCGLAPDTEDPAHPRDALLDLTSALGIWNATWGTPGVHLRPELQKMNIPFEYASPPGPGQWEGTAAPAFDQQMYDLQDADSSKEY